MSSELTKRDDADKIERVLIGGDLAQLKPEERVSYYRMVCESVGLNPLTKPFEYITLNGKLTLYARKDATDQLRSIHNISVEIVGREVVDDCYVVTTKAVTPTGRTDGSIGAVPVGALKGEAKCNAMMKAETKAKRRVTLSICGLGLLDETEIESIPARSLKEVTKTTEDIELEPPKSAPANSGQGESVLQRGDDSPASAETSARLPVKAQAVVDTPVPSPTSTVETPGLAAIPIPGAGCIGTGEAANLHREFRNTLPKKFQKDADALLSDWLRVQTPPIVDVLGKPSALAIKKESFYDIRTAVCDYARTFAV